ncbi:MAG: tetratricopeptide repeat protein [Proteobacteria bacterium]|nr:tetratricopeptide repeat protein [Pseudomonadota bacterium]
MKTFLLLAALAAAPPHETLPSAPGTDLPPACSEAAGAMRSAYGADSGKDTFFHQALDAADRCVQQGGGVPGLIIRGEAHFGLNQFDLALADLDDALKREPFSGIARFDRGLIYLQAKNYQGAVDDFTAAIEVNPADLDSRFERGWTWLLLNQPDKALPDLSAVIEKYPSYEPALRLRGLVYASKGQWDEAIADDSAAIAADATDDDAFFNRGLAYAGAGRHKEAIADFDIVLSRSPGDSRTLYERGRSKQSLKDIDGAIADFSASLKVKPDSAVYNDRGVAYEAKGDIEKALADYSAAITADPGDETAIRNRVTLLFNKRRFSEAIDDLSDLISRDAKDVAALRLRAFAYAQKGEPDLAIADYSAALALAPDDADTLFYRALTYTTKRDYVHALADLDAAIAHAPKNADALCWRARVRDAGNDSAGALNDFTACLAIDPQASAFNERGEIHERRGERDAARADYDKALSLDPTLAAPRRNRVHLTMLGGDYAAAIADLDILIVAAPKDPALYRLRAFSREMRGELDKAVADYSTALDIEPDATTRLYRGRAYSRLQRFDDALADFAAAVALKPDSVEAHIALAGAYDYRRDFAGALDQIGKAIALSPRDGRLLLMRAGIEREDGNDAAMQTDAKAGIDLLSADIARDPKAASGYYSRAQGYEILKRFGDAIADLGTALTLEPGNLAALKMRARLYGRNRQPDLALRDLASAIALAPGDSSLHVLRGDTLLANRDFTGAIAELDRAVALGDTTSGTLNDRCWARAVANVELPTALADCRKALSVSQRPAIIDSLAMVQFRMGQFADALASYDKALSINPKQPSSLYMRGLVKLRLGQTDAGKADIAAALALDPGIAGTFKDFGLSP